MASVLCPHSMDLRDAGTRLEFNFINFDLLQRKYDNIGLLGYSSYLQLFDFIIFQLEFSPIKYGAPDIIVLELLHRCQFYYIKYADF